MELPPLPFGLHFSPVSDKLNLQLHHYLSIRMMDLSLVSGKSIAKS